MKSSNDKKGRFSRSFRDAPIFAKVLAGSIALVLFVVLLTGLFSHLLVNRYIIRTTQAELLDKAESLSETLSDPANQRVFFSARLLRAIEDLSGAHLILVDNDRTAQHLPLPRRDRQAGPAGAAAPEELPAPIGADEMIQT